MPTALRRKARTALRLARAAAARQRLRALPWDSRLVRRRLAARSALSSVVDGPLVSVVVVARDHRPLPARLRRAIERTTYRPVELLVSASTPETRAEAISAVLARAGGELVCLLDPAAEPIRDDWLGHLVGSVLDGAVAAGPLIIRAPGRGYVSTGQRERDLTLLSAGIDFVRAAGVALPRHVAKGTDPGGAVGRVGPVPAAAAACLVARREDLVRAGVPDGYRYDGVESGPTAAPLFDADLAIRLRERGGTIVCDGRAAILYRTDDGPSVPAAVRAAIRSEPPEDAELDVFLDRWGPRLGREVLLDVISGRHEWSVRPLGVRIDGEAPATGGEASATDGTQDAVPGPVGTGILLPLGGPAGLDWRIERGPGTDDPASADVLISDGTGTDIGAIPTGIVRVAWVAGPGPEPDHLQEYDVIVAPDPAVATRLEVATGKPVVRADLRAPGAGERLRHALDRWATAKRVGIRIGVPRWDAAESWGDYHVARSLQRELERDGFPTRIHLRPAWATAVGAREDASIHLFGLKAAPTRPAQVNLLWQISHPDLASPGMYDRYDAAFVASDRFATRMAAVTATPVRPLHQATDPQRLAPDPTGPHHELLFVANSRNVRRTIVDHLADTHHDLAVYGQKWTPDLVDPRFVRGELVPGGDLARYYSSADIVLNDHWQDMRAEGFISNRIYDALACGAFVISDHLDEIEDEFDGAVPTFRDKAGLEALIERYLDDPGARRSMAERGRAAVLERHTFRARADAIVATLGPLLAGRLARIVDSGS
jgi:Glycosyl transferases group 1